MKSTVLSEHFKSFGNLLESQNALLLSIDGYLKKIQAESIYSELFIIVTSAIVGAFAAYLFNRFHWIQIESKKKVSDLATNLDALISELDQVSVDYWLRNYDENIDPGVEIKIKSLHRLVTSYTSSFNGSCPKESKLASDLTDFSARIFDVITGDDFESRLRVLSKPKAGAISRQCSQIRAKLCKAKFN